MGDEGVAGTQMMERPSQGRQISRQERGGKQGRRGPMRELDRREGGEEMGGVEGEEPVISMCSVKKKVYYQ